MRSCSHEPISVTTVPVAASRSSGCIEVFSKYPDLNYGIKESFTYKILSSSEARLDSRQKPLLFLKFPWCTTLPTASWRTEQPSASVLATRREPGQVTAWMEPLIRSGTYVSVCCTTHHHPPPGADSRTSCSDQNGSSFYISTYYDGSLPKLINYVFIILVK